MEIKDIKKRERRSKVMSIRTTAEISEWMRKNNVSPTALFNRAALELMKKE